MDRFVSPLNFWLNILTVLMIVGLAFWVSLWPYMTRGDE